MRAPPRGPAPGGDDDATVKQPLPPVPRARARSRWLISGAAAVAVAGVVAVVLLRPARPPSPPPPAPTTHAPATPTPQAPAAPPPAVTPPARPPETPPVLPPRTADEAAILADPAEQLTLFYFAPEPQIAVLDFPSLEQQGRALNRVAALVEKAGLPRDRVLTDAELADAIRASGDTTATYYYGHDYPAADLARFFALADRDHVALGPDEEKLRDLARQLGWLTPGSPDKPHGALISLSRQGADPDITPAVRAVILHHELSHGAFFAEPVYAEYVRQFWQTALSEPERDAIRKFLGSEDYDIADGTLVVNEMQAYLMFTYDPHFFLASSVGMTDARRAELQAAFRRDLPVAWLRDAMPPPAPPAAVATTPAVAATPPATAAAAAAPAAAATTVERRGISAPSGSRQPAATHH